MRINQLIIFQCFVLCSFYKKRLVNSLIKFFATYGVYFYFVALEIFSLVLIVNYNYFQRSRVFSAMNELSGILYNLEESVTDYFSLKSVNEELSEENARLRNDLFLMQQFAYKKAMRQDSVVQMLENPRLSYMSMSAKVINNSVHKLQNYITINRGSKNGICQDMSVISSCGVVGVVKSVSDHFAMVVPVLNPRIRISCKIKLKAKSAQDLSVGQVKDIGSLVWYGGDYRFASMEQVPRHVEIEKGDTVITSGYSDYFPEGIMVGTIESFDKATDDNYYDIKVRLSVNFSTLSYVEVLDYKYKKEQEELESAILTDK